MVLLTASSPVCLTCLLMCYSTSHKCWRLQCTRILKAALLPVISLKHLHVGRRAANVAGSGSLFASGCREANACPHFARLFWRATSVPLAWGSIAPHDYRNLAAFFDTASRRAWHLFAGPMFICMILFPNSPRLISQTLGCESVGFCKSDECGRISGRRFQVLGTSGWPNISGTALHRGV